MVVAMVLHLPDLLDELLDLLLDLLDELLDLLHEALHRSLHLLGDGRARCRCAGTRAPGRRRRFRHESRIGVRILVLGLLELALTLLCRPGGRKAKLQNEHNRHKPAGLHEGAPDTMQHRQGSQNRCC
jgi:hypothetical protein